MLLMQAVLEAIFSGVNLLFIGGLSRVCRDVGAGDEVFRYGEWVFSVALLTTLPTQCVPRLLCRT